MSPSLGQTLADFAVQEVTDRIRSADSKKLADMRAYFAHMLVVAEAEIAKRKQDGEP